MEFKRNLLKKIFRELCPFLVDRVNHIQQSTECIFTFLRQNILEHAFVRIFASPFDSVNGAVVSRKRQKVLCAKETLGS